MKILTDAEQNKAEVRLRNWENTYRTDSLTGLLNHAAFRNDMEMKLLSGDFNAMMIMIDVDKFKQYNDTYGHHNGDKYLILVAQTLLASLRNEDFASRMGGDEFAVMMFFNKSVPEKAIKEHAQQIFDKVNLTVKSAEEVPASLWAQSLLSQKQPLTGYMRKQIMHYTRRRKAEEADWS